MHSSTSSSDERLPKSSGFRVWTLGALFFSLLLIVVELVARNSGYAPMPADSMAHWARQRENASKAGKDSVALLGSSRVLTGIVPEELERCLPGTKVCMLAIAATHPMTMLENLADDQTFMGTIICDLDAHDFSPDRWDSQRPYVEYYDKAWSKSLRLSTNVGIVLEQNLSLLHEGLSLPAMINRLFHIPYYNYQVRRVSRFKENHFERLGEHLAVMNEQRRKEERLAAERKNLAPSPELYDGYYAKAETSIRRLIDRGCRVVFVQMPTSGPPLAFEQQLYPRRDFWDHFVRQTAAETIHFQDYGSLSGFNCPDDSHLEYEDAVRFTRALAGLLQEGADARGEPRNGTRLTGAERVKGNSVAEGVPTPAGRNT